MKKYAAGCIGWIFKLGMLYALLQIFITTWLGLSPHIASGRKMALLSIGIIIAFAYWQYLGLNDIIKNPNKNRFNKLMIGTGLFALILMLITVGGQYFFHFFPGTMLESWVNSSGIKVNEDFVIENGSVFLHLAVAFGIFLFIVIICGSILSVLALGRLALGFNIAFTTHNWFNGSGFDPSKFIEILIGAIGEIAVSDMVGVLISLLWALITSLFLKKGGTEISVDS